MSSSAAADRARIADSAVATGRGDDGTTGLLYGGRTAKDDLAVEAYGTIDETVAALGVARAELACLAADGPDRRSLSSSWVCSCGSSGSCSWPVQSWPPIRQRRDRLQDGVTRVDEPMLLHVEVDLATWEARIEMPREFVRAGRDPGVGRARGRPGDHATCGASGHRASANRTRHGDLARAVAQPRRGPAVGPGPRGRADGGRCLHAGRPRWDCGCPSWYGRSGGWIVGRR